MGWIGDIGDWIGDHAGAIGGTLIAPGIGTFLGSASDSARSGNSAIDAEIQSNGMSMPSQLNPNALPSNIAELDSRMRAAGTTPSPWLKMATQNQNAAQNSAVDQAMAQGAGGAAQARTQLAMRGGLSGGAGERVAMGGIQAGMQGANTIRNQGLQDKMQLGMQDYTNQRADVNTWAGLAQNEANNKSDLMKTNYQEQMRAWAANTAANAELAAGKKSGLLGLGFLGL